MNRTTIFNNYSNDGYSQALVPLMDTYGAYCDVSDMICDYYIVLMSSTYTTTHHYATSTLAITLDSIMCVTMHVKQWIWI